MKYITTILALALLTTGAYGATTYKSISITPEAKAKVVNVAKELKMSQRDTTSLMIMEWGEPKNNLLENLKTLFLNDTSGTEQKVLNLCTILNS